MTVRMDTPGMQDCSSSADYPTNETSARSVRSSLVVASLSQLLGSEVARE